MDYSQSIRYSQSLRYSPSLRSFDRMSMASTSTLQANGVPTPADQMSISDMALMPESRDVEKGENGGMSMAKPSSMKDPNIVEWDGPDDPYNPMNWSFAKKCTFTAAMSGLTWVVTFASSVFSTATRQTAELYGVSEEVTTLGTSFFVLGYALGPLMWGPLSELYGRKIPLYTGFVVMAIFQIPVGAAQNLATILICRFIGGVFGCAPLAVVGGAMADVWQPIARGIAFCMFSGATFIGPVAGPVMGGFIVDSYLGWRWTAWITLIMCGFFGVIGFFAIPESYGPVLLSRKATNIRYQTQNWAIHAKHDEKRVDARELVVKYFLRPFEMLIKEPILLLVTLYLGLIYGILYLFLEAYPISFGQQRGYNTGVAALPFLAIIVGVVLAVAYVAYDSKTRYARKLMVSGKVVPEDRLIPMIVGAFILPAGLFWFAWTSSPHITWVPQVISGVFIGAGILLIFIQGLSYIVDVYLMYANSALAGNTFVRSLAGAGFPLFATAMYHKLGVAWATSLLAFLSIAMIPVPILFYIYGAHIRRMSVFSPTGK